MMFLSCATRQNENVGLISCVHSLRISLGLFCFSFFKTAVGGCADSFSSLRSCVVWGGATGIEDINCCLLLFLQERTRSFDSFSMHSLENSLIDIMRAEQDSLKGSFTYCRKGDCVLLFQLKKTQCLLGHKYFVATEILKRPLVFCSQMERHLKWFTPWSTHLCFFFFFNFYFTTFQGSFSYPSLVWSFLIYRPSHANWYFLLYFMQTHQNIPES